jgi:hypothetical protein
MAAVVSVPGRTGRRTLRTPDESDSSTVKVS